MNEKRVIYTINNHVAEVCLNRPDKRNALDFEMFEALIEVGKTIKRTSEVRAVIVHGAGSSFCAGLDFMSMMSLKDGLEKMLEPSEESPANFAQRAAWIWNEIEVPVIMVLHGAVFGGGLQIALSADIRIASPNTKLSIMETKWGLCPDMTLSQTLLKLVRLDVAKRLTYTAEVIEASEAKELGLVTEVIEEPLTRARELAKLISGKSPHAIRACKHLLDTAPTLDTDKAFQLEEKLQRELIGSTNQIEAIQANFMKRKPNFIDPS